MQIEINAVHTFKFNSGEEVIAKVTAFEDPWVTVNEPVAVAPGPQGMGLIPALFTADHGQNISINIDNCTFVALTDDAVTNKYIQATTGITVPDKKIVLG
jgi:hypothetical protein